MPQVQIGISACLLGQRVRYDGGDRKSALIANELASHVDFVPFCPEVEIGLGVPRPPVRLVGDPRRPRMLGVDDARLDVTQRMANFSGQVGVRLTPLSGFIFKSRSPSCGVTDTSVFDEAGVPRTYGAGLFARAVAQHAPLLPMEDERRLECRAVRDHFFERVFAFYRWREQVLAHPGLPALRAFHVAHKYALLAHSEPTYRALGPWLAVQRAPEGAVEFYGARFFAALLRPTTRASHVNVLQHLLGYFKKAASPDERKTATEVLQHYRDGVIEFDAVLEVLRALNARYPNDYLLKQKYLYLDAGEAALRLSGLDARSGAADR